MIKIVKKFTLRRILKLLKLIFLAIFSLRYPYNWRGFIFFLSSYLKTTEMNKNLIFKDIDDYKSTKPVNKIGDLLIKYLNTTSKKILIVTHELSRTGAPQVVVYLSKVLYEIYGVYPIVISPVDGPLRNDLESLGVKVIIEENLFFDYNKSTMILLSAFDFIIINSISCFLFIYLYSKINVKIFLWLHESEESFDSNILPYYKNAEKIFTSVSEVWCGAPACISLAERYTNNLRYLFYSVPDTSNIVKTKQNDKLVFILAGSFEPRKSQHTLIQAVTDLPKELRSKAVFKIIGISTNKPLSNYEKRILHLANNNPEIEIIPSMPLNDLINLYTQSDVLISTSTDDPLPIVVTYAWMLGMPCIISNKIGHSKIVNNYPGIMIFPANDFKKLSFYISNFINKPDLITKPEFNTRIFYEKYFSTDKFKEKLKLIFNDNKS